VRGWFSLVGLEHAGRAYFPGLPRGQPANSINGFLPYMSKPPRGIMRGLQQEVSVRRLEFFQIALKNLVSRLVHHEDVGLAGLPLPDGDRLPGFEVADLTDFEFEQVAGP